MAESIYQSYADAFDTILRQKAQQRRPRFWDHCVQKTNVVGERQTFPHVEQEEDEEITQRDGEWADPPTAEHDDRSAFKRDFEWRRRISVNDEQRMVVDLRSGYADSALYANNRRTDRIILEAAISEAASGQYGQSSTAFPATSILDKTAAAVDENTLIELRRLFDDSEEMYEDLDETDENAFCIAMHPTAHEQFMRSVKITSNDYYEYRAADGTVSQRPLVGGRIPFYMGFRIRVTKQMEQLPANLQPQNANFRRNIVWHRSGIGCAQWNPGSTVIVQIDSQKGRPWNVIRNYSVGAVRLKETAVFAFDTDITK